MEIFQRPSFIRSFRGIRESETLEEYLNRKVAFLRTICSNGGMNKGRDLIYFSKNREKSSTTVFTVFLEGDFYYISRNLARKKLNTINFQRNILGVQ